MIDQCCCIFLMFLIRLVSPSLCDYPRVTRGALTSEGVCRQIRAYYSSELTFHHPSQVETPEGVYAPWTSSHPARSHVLRRCLSGMAAESRRRWLAAENNRPKQNSAPTSPRKKTTKPSSMKPAGVRVSNTKGWRRPLFQHPEIHQSEGQLHLFRSASTHTPFSLFRPPLQTFLHTGDLLKVHAAPPAHLLKYDSL